MSSFNQNELSKFNIVWLGDTTVPWFDRHWPFNGPRMQEYYGELIDIQELEPIVGVAGTTIGVVFPHSTAENWEEMLAQKILAKHKGEWVVLRKQAKTCDVYKKVPGLEDYLDLDSEFIGPRSMETLGREGTIGKRAITWRDAAFVEHVLAFHGDDTLRKVVDVLAEWGFVTSKHWLKLLEKHPSLGGLIPYLIEKQVLFSNGTHPSHFITSAGGPVYVDRGPTAVIVAGDKEIPIPNGDLTHHTVDTRSEKQKRNDWLLDKRGLETDAKLTFPELADLLTKEAVKTGWVTLEASSISDALRESFKRRHKNVPWPFDGRGKKGKQGNKE